MATFKFEVNTQAGAVRLGAVSIEIVPNPLIVTGYYAFGVVAPNGSVLKSINPSFYTNPTGGSSDFDLTTNATMTFDTLAVMPTDANGDYMSGTYKLSVAYVENLSNATQDKQDIRTVSFVYCNAKNGGQHKGQLTTKFATLANQVIVNDVTNYTGLTVATHTISSTLLTGGVPIVVTSYSQTLPFAAYSSVLAANVSKSNATIYGDIAVLDVFTVSATINTPTDFIDFKTTIDKAAAKLKEFRVKRCGMLSLSLSDTYKANYITQTLGLINAYALIGDDVNLNSELKNLYEFLLKC